MDHRQIERLLDKYFEGTSSLEEEKQLRDLFRRPSEVPRGLEPYAPLFRHFDAEQELELSDAFDERLLASLDAPSPGRRPRLWPVLARVAAVLLLAFGVWWIYPTEPPAPQQAAINWEQYEPATPEEAYRVVRLALLRTSSELNEGARTAAKEIDKLNEVGRFFK